jgi:hypothetical protein
MDAARRKVEVCALDAEPTASDLRYFARDWSASTILAYLAALMLARMLRLGFAPAFCKLEATGTQIGRRDSQKDKRVMLSMRKKAGLAGEQFRREPDSVRISFRFQCDHQGRPAMKWVLFS